MSRLFRSELIRQMINQHHSFYILHFLWEKHSASKIVTESHSHSNNEKTCKWKKYLFPKSVNYFHTIMKDTDKFNNPYCEYLHIVFSYIQGKYYAKIEMMFCEKYTFQFVPKNPFSPGQNLASLFSYSSNRLAKSFPVYLHVAGVLR